MEHVLLYVYCDYAITYNCYWSANCFTCKQIMFCCWGIL